MRVSELLRRVAVLGGPAALGLLEIWHPHFDSGDMSTLIPQVNTWLLVHLLQIPLFGAAALTLYLLAGRAGGWFAHASRLAVGVFVVLYIALDSVAGVAVGLLVQRAASLPAAEQGALLEAAGVLFRNPIAGGTLSLIGMLGSLAWLVAAVAAGVAVMLAGGSRIPAGLLMFSGLSLFTGHFPPFGPVAMAALLGAALWLEFAPQRQSVPAPLPQIEATAAGGG